MQYKSLGNSSLKISNVCLDTMSLAEIVITRLGLPIYFIWKRRT